MSTSSFIFYTLFILLPHYLHQLPFLPPPPPPTEYAATLAGAGIKESKTKYVPTDYEVIAATERLRQPPLFWRRIWCHACCYLWQRSLFPPTLAIYCHFCHRHWWWIPIGAYTMSSLIISSNISVPNPELFQPQMGLFTFWTSTVPVIGAQFKVHVLGSKTLFWINWNVPIHVEESFAYIVGCFFFGLKVRNRYPKLMAFSREVIF